MRCIPPPAAKAQQRNTFAEQRLLQASALGATTPHTNKAAQYNWDNPVYINTLHATDFMVSQIGGYCR